MSDYLNQDQNKNNQNVNVQPSQPQPDFTPPTQSFGSGVDNSPQGKMNRTLGGLGITLKVLLILAIGGALLAGIGFTGYRYVASSVAEMLKNPYDVINEEDTLAGIPETIIVDAVNGEAIPTSGNPGSSGGSGSAGSTGGGSSNNGGGSTNNGGNDEPDLPGVTPDPDVIIIIDDDPLFPVASPGNLNTTRTTTSGAGFKHPGVMLSLSQLNSTRGKIAAKQDPWLKSALLAKNSSAAIQKPTLTGMVQVDNPSKPCNPSNPGNGCKVVCGYNSIPNLGCKDETGDARAAYTQALLWYYSGDEKYAQSAIAILNGWSSVLKKHEDQNRALQLAWSADTFVRAAEIIRYTYTPSAGKASFNEAQFKSMLDTAFLPILTTYNYAGYNGNWNLSAINAKINIAVYKDDRGLYNTALNQWRTATKAYIYLKSDGPLPVEPGKEQSGKVQLSCFWLSNRGSDCKAKPKRDPKLTFFNGQVQETCRDFGHVGMGLGAMVNTAETAAHQGTDLYGEQRERIMAGYSFTAQVMLSHGTSGFPKGLCNNEALGTPSAGLPVEMLNNAYVNRKGNALDAISIPGIANVLRFGNTNPILSVQQRNLETLLKNNKESVGLISSWEILTYKNSGW
jgi:hypothetical protein